MYHKEIIYYSGIVLFCGPCHFLIPPFPLLYCAVGGEGGWRGGIVGGLERGAGWGMRGEECKNQV